jgi:hypothetical protein
MSLDDFREAGAFLEEEESPSPRQKNRSASGRIIRSTTGGGLTPAQRFILSFLLFLMTVLIGVAFLLISGRVVPPGLY